MSSGSSGRRLTALDVASQAIRDDIRSLTDAVRPVGIALPLIDARVSSLEKKQPDVDDINKRLIRIEERMLHVMSWGGNFKWILTSLIAIIVPILIKLVWH